MIIIALIVGIFLRVYLIGSNYFFTGELGNELLYTRQLIAHGTFPLVGLMTSHEWLTYGPIYYWILVPLVKIFGGAPLILFWVALAVSVIGTYLSYSVFSKIVDRKFAVLLSFFISLSPLWIWATRLSKLHTLFFMLIPVVIYFLYRIWRNDIKKMFWLGISYGALFSFHFSQIPILLVIAAEFWIKRKSLKTRDYLKFFVGLILPNITILIHDAKNGFAMTRNLILWVPYRIAGFTGFYPKNNLDVASGMGTLTAFNEFFGRNLFWDSRFWILGTLIFIVLFVIFIIKNRKKYTKDFFTFYLITATVVQCLALLIHTSPPLHYFLPIFLNFGLLFAYFAAENWERRITKVLTILIFVLMFVAGANGMKNEHAGDIDYVPIAEQEAVAKYIVTDAKGLPFKLTRVGPFDYFPENYDQNYQYLIMLAGGHIDKSAKPEYIIVDGRETVNVLKHE